MATFRVGQRVRIVITDPASHGYCFNGAETVISGPRESCAFSRNPYWPTAATDAAGIVGVYEDRLVPLVDGYAEKFIATVKLWGPLKEREVA